MLDKVYYSNICPLWSFKRQEVVVVEKMGATERIDFVDELTPAQRRKHKKAMPQREYLLRATSRKAPCRINFPSFAVAASTAEDFLLVLSRAADLKAELRDLHADILVRTKRDWTPAIEAFEAAKRKVGEVEHGRAGGLRSAQVRGSKVREAAEKCRPLWRLPKPSSEELAEQHGVSVGGLKAILGSRRLARTEHQAELKRKARRQKAKAA